MHLLNVLTYISLIFSSSAFLENYEILATSPPESLEATPKCGQNKQENKFTCVPYYNCDFFTNTVIEKPQIDGSNIIPYRAHPFDPTCDNFLHVCCQISNSTTPSNNPLPAVELTDSEELLWNNCGVPDSVQGLDQPWIIEPPIGRRE